MDDRIMKSETRQFKVIFPNTLNDHDTLFGGTAMQWMDEVAYITAIRFSRKKMVTVSAEKVQFLLPMKSGTIAEIIGKVIKVRNVKIEIQVEIYIEDMYTDNRQKAVDALFTFAAINDENKPIPIDNKKYSSQEV
ncbi:MAG: acyl-CoA thioesterase [Vicingaceae bacterium]|jgi:acyl-CoA hydrolase